jgi:hypothetical protein
MPPTWTAARIVLPSLFSVMARTPSGGPPANHSLRPGTISKLFSLTGPLLGERRTIAASLIPPQRISGSTGTYRLDFKVDVGEFLPCPIVRTTPDFLLVDDCNATAIYMGGKWSQTPASKLDPRLVEFVENATPRISGNQNRTHSGCAPARAIQTIGCRNIRPYAMNAMRRPSAPLRIVVATSRYLTCTQTNRRLSTARTVAARIVS